MLPHAMDLYKRMETIDGLRQEKDYITFLLLSQDEKCLKKECQDVVQRVLKDHACSTRLQNIFKRILNDEDRVAKHSLLLFAMAYDPQLLQGWSKNVKVPPEKMNIFINHYLHQNIKNLLEGTFTSVRAFVEDLRWHYITI